MRIISETLNLETVDIICSYIESKVQLGQCSIGSLLAPHGFISDNDPLSLSLGKGLLSTYSDIGAATSNIANCSLQLLTPNDELCVSGCGLNYLFNVYSMNANPLLIQCEGDTSLLNVRSVILSNGEIQSVRIDSDWSLVAMGTFAG